MLSNKKGRMLRHPYATLAIIGLATAGALSITSKVKTMFSCKKECISNMMKGMKDSSRDMI